MPTDPHTRAARRDQTLAAINRLAFNPGPIAAVMQADGDDPDQLIDVLSRCPVLTARLIAVANSAGNSALHRMDTIERCVRHLGGKQTRTVALTLAMQLVTQDLELDEDTVKALWASAATKATAAAMVCEVVSPDQADRAYCLGLVQDIALPILLALDPAFFTGKLVNADARTPWTGLERQHFGIDHAELGATLLTRWGAPEALVGQVARHHTALADDDMAWLAEMPARFAGLLPHMGEQTTKAQAQTLTAAHARFLADGYTSLDDLLEEAKRRVKAMGKAAGGPVRLSPDFVQQINRAVAADTFALVAQVARLDRQLAEQVQSLASIQADALSDPLTGLLNRRGFESFGTQMLAQARKNHLAAACLVIDLDDFKPVNDSFGHAAGDTLLKAAASLIRSSVAAGDLVARLGGDEFAVLIVGNAQGDAHALAQRVHGTCNGRTINLGNGQKAKLKMSLGGVYQHNLDAQTSVDSLLDAGDQVMYQCKQQGKSRLEFRAIQQRDAA